MQDAVQSGDTLIFQKPLRLYHRDGHGYHDFAIGETLDVVSVDYDPDEQVRDIEACVPVLNIDYQMPSIWEGEYRDTSDPSSDMDWATFGEYFSIARR